MRQIGSIRALPDDIEVLTAAAAAENIRLVTRLVEDHRSGDNRFDMPGEGLWEARDDGGLVGVCGLNQDPFAEVEERAGRVRRLYVLPEWRRLGVASELVDVVEQQARGCFAVLTAFTTDAGAAAFYRTRGYEPVTGVTKRSFQLRLSNTTSPP